MHRVPAHRFLPLLALASLVGACGSGDAEARAGAAGEPAVLSSPTSSATPARGAGDAVEVTVGGPPHEGTHRGSGHLGCMVHNGLWQAAWEAPEETGLSGLLLQLKEVPTSGGSSTRLTLTAVFGSQVTPDAITALVDVHGSEFGGDGRGTVTREGEGAVIRVEGTARHGARVTAVLRCASVDVLS